MSVGQELDQLMKSGYSVFHDLPGDKPFNIDHVVVGPNGVFAVETKGRAKPVNRAARDGHKVQYRDEKLYFPGWMEDRPIEQAKMNAKWLSRWLSSAVGVHIDVTPIVVLPGWYVETQYRPLVLVLSGNQCQSFIPKIPGGPVSDQQLRQISHQLDSRCRDIEPHSHKPLAD
jgi:hypothetical protein